VAQRRGLRNSAADAYLHPARRRRNLTVLTGAYAQRILLDGARATGVEYRDAAGVTQRVTASREVILSAGAVNSPRLLMLSGIGNPERCAPWAWSHVTTWWVLVRTAGPPGLRGHRALPEAGHTLRGRLPRPSSPDSYSCVAGCSLPA
jgi:hypothetical protein